MMHRRIFLFLCLLLSFSTRDLFSQDLKRDPFQIDYDAHLIKVNAGESFKFAVAFKIPQGFYLYDDKTSVLFDETGDIEFIKFERPPPEDHEDPFLKKKAKVYFKDFWETLYFYVPPDAKLGRLTLEATLRYQGCSNDFCYKPVRKTILLPVEVKARTATLQSGEAPSSPGTLGPPGHPEKEPGFWEMIQETNPERLLERGRVTLLALALVGGILTSLTPCVLPIIPLTLAFIGVKHRRRGNILRAVMLVAGMVFMYSVLGFFAASLGLKLGFLFQSRHFVLLVALFFFVFSLGLFEIIPFHLPPKLHNKLVRLGGEGPKGAFVAGLTVGLIASPCVGPLIAPLLLIAARTQDRLYGFALLFNYGMGMGLIFLVLGAAYAELAGVIRSGKWTHALKRVLAVLMLAPALYYSYAFAKPFFGPARDSLWIYQFEEGLNLAKETGKPVLMDFYADWCPPCHELDVRTFSSPEVREFAKNFVMLKIDCTVDDQNCEHATEAYQVVGWPSVLFLKSNGELIPDVKLVGGFADVDRMLELMREGLEKAKKL